MGILVENKLASGTKELAPREDGHLQHKIPIFFMFSYLFETKDSASEKNNRGSSEKYSITSTYMNMRQDAGPACTHLVLSINLDLIFSLVM